VVALIRLRAELRRGPAAPGRRLELPYFVAVMDGDQVLDRRGFVLEATFPANADSIRVAGEELQLRLPGGGERGAARYRIIVSLQLTPEELAFNRGQGR
jgi:hypothetical protein